MARQRPLFVDWPAWQTLPTNVHQQVEQVLANMYLEVVTTSSDPKEVPTTSERCDERSTD